MLVKKFVTFCIIGVLSAIVDLLVFNTLFLIGASFILSRTVAVLSAISSNFFLNRNITFKARHTSIMKQYPKHLIVYTIVLITNVAVSSTVFWLLGEGNLNANIASISGILSAIPISFLGSLLWTFKKNH